LPIIENEGQQEDPHQNQEGDINEYEEANFNIQDSPSRGDVVIEVMEEGGSS
jgi:hypothetical protein